MGGDRRIREITAWCLAAGVIMLTLGFAVSPRGTFSENENRYLAELPELSWENLQSGQFMSDISTYLSDHFLFRDFFMGLKTQAELLAGRKEINGVYIADDGYLIEHYEKPVNTEKIGEILENFSQKIAEMEKTEDRRLELRLMLVPTASLILEDLLPDDAPMYSQAETIRQLWERSGIQPVSCEEFLRTAKEKGQIYYRLDHHWTTFGAYAGYLAFCRDRGFAPVSLEELQAETVTEDFRGTVYSKVNDYTRIGDRIVIYVNPQDRLTVEYMDTGETSDSLYNLEYLEQKDKYSLFLDNLHSLITITNETAETERELVLLKDSYANSLVPFLTHHYRRI